CFELGRATVVVTEDQLSLAIGKRGQNVRLAARLTGWDIDILTPGEFNTGLDVLEKALREVEQVDSTIVDQIIAMGMVNVLDVEEVGPEPLINELTLDRELAQKIVVRCAEEAKRVAEQQAAAAREAAEAEKSAASKGDEEETAQDEKPAEPGQATEPVEAKTESEAADQADQAEQPVEPDQAGQVDEPETTEPTVEAPTSQTPDQEPGEPAPNEPAEEPKGNLPA
ncbi:MAG: hypothetical protein SVT52_02890, partial [Planctomycetota bacterium]|nr:hypothetical protein [Planctomycetota bacterium]